MIGRPGGIILAVAGIGAGLRSECRVAPDDGSAEADQQVDQNVVVTNTEGAVGQNLNRRVPVAHVPGEAKALGCPWREDVGHRLERGPDADDTATREEEPVTLRQHNRPRKIEQKNFARIISHEHPATMALIECKAHRGDRRVTGPLSCRDDARHPPQFRSGFQNKK